MRSRLVTLLLLANAASARADFDHPSPGEVIVREWMGSEGKGMEGHTVVDAPQVSVLRWWQEIEFWPGRFRDVKETRVLARGERTMRVWIDSNIMQQVAVTVHVTNDGITYETNDDRVVATGRVVVRALGGGRSDVVMQTTAKLRGLLGVLAPKNMVRDRERQKLISDLGDLNRLARLHRSARRMKKMRQPSTVATGPEATTNAARIP